VSERNFWYSVLFYLLDFRIENTHSFQVAEEIGKHDTIGIDLVAMSVNDILTHNAEPLFFLDYFATGKLSAETAGLVLKGITVGCVDSNCSLIGIF
jgi:phosphoribosylaminoimidazole (AIR) synthetase